jgi:RNA polymerase sigma-70 factor (ECF subfamily)
LGVAPPAGGAKTGNTSAPGGVGEVMDMPARPIRPSGPAEALARLARGRDVEAWTWLIEEVGDQIRACAGRLSEDAASADDAAQEALLTIRDHARQFRPRGDADADARRWILRVAANSALSLRRARRRARDRDLRAGAEPMPLPPDSADRLEREETASALRDALAELGEPERTAIVLRVVEGLGYDQVAAELRCAEGTARSRVSRGLEHLRARLAPRQLALGAIPGLLPNAVAPGPLAPGAAALIHSPATASAVAVPAALGGTAMVVKLALAAALVAAISTPAVIGWRQAAPVEVTPAAPPASVAPRATTAPRDTVAPRAAAVPADLERQLSQEMHVEFADTSVADVLAFFARVGVPIAADASLRDGPAKVTLTVDQVKARSVVAWVAELVDAHQVEEGGELRLVAGRAASTAPALDAAAMQADQAIPAALHEKLVQRMTLEFDGTAITDAIGMIRQVTGMNLIIDPRQVAAAKPAVIKVRDARVAEVLAQLAADQGLAWVYRDEALYLTSPPPSAEPPMPREKR